MQIASGDGTNPLYVLLFLAVTAQQVRYSAVNSNKKATPDIDKPLCLVYNFHGVIIIGVNNGGNVMRKRIMAIVLAGLMLTQSPFVGIAETLQAEGELAAGDLTAAGFVQTAAEISAPAEVSEGEAAEIVEELPAESLSGEAAQEEIVPEEFPEEIPALPEELVVPEEDLFELTEEAGEDTDELSLQEELPEENSEAQNGESLIPAEEPGEGTEDGELVTEDNPTRQAADEFFGAANAILSTMSFANDSPNAVGTSQLTKDIASRTLRLAIAASTTKDEDGNNYISYGTTVDGVGIVNRIYYLAHYAEFLFESEFRTEIDGVTYTAVINISVPYGNKSDVEASYFLDTIGSGLNYLTARAVIAAPSSYKGTEDIEFIVEGLDDDLLDYEVQDLANTTLKASFGTWNFMLLSKAKVSMRTLGFDNFVMTHTHTYHKVNAVHATVSRDGCIYDICSSCGDIRSSTTVPYVSTIALTFDKAGYTGTVLRPSVIIKDRTGAALNTKYYSVVFSNANSTNIGNYKVSITLKDIYYGSKTLYYSIVKPADAVAMPKLNKANNLSDGIGIYFYPVSGATSYVIFRKENNRWRAIRGLDVGSPYLTTAGTRLYYKDTTVKNSYGTPYSYSVAAMIGSSLSAFDTAGIDIIRLQPPTITKVIKRDEGIAKVFWNAVKCEGYQVQYTDGSGKWYIWPETTNTFRNITHLKTGVKYYFRVRSFATSKKMGVYYSDYGNHVPFILN